MKIGSISYIFALLFVFGGCSSNSFIVGRDSGFCSDCGYKYKGVCANPMDVYNKADRIMSKKVKPCVKSKRNGERE